MGEGAANLPHPHQSWQLHVVVDAVEKTLSKLSKNYQKITNKGRASDFPRSVEQIKIH